MARRNRYTVYDMMDEKGVFEKNPANTCSPNYKGPIEYPKMLYHPKGEYRTTQKAEILVTPIGPQMVGEQKELINTVAADAEEEERLRAEGWHLHPALAIAAGGGVAPAMGKNLVSAAELENEKLRKRIAELEAMAVASTPVISRRGVEASA